MHEPYLTPQNHQGKITEWQTAISPFDKRKKELNIPNSALLVIDMQDYFLDPKSHAHINPGTIVTSNIKQLIKQYREANRPVIYTYFSTKPGEPDPLSNWWHNQSITTDNLTAQLDPQPTDLILRKNTYSTFHSPDAHQLHKLLKDTNTQQIVITGILTNLCCETAAREAFQHNLDVFLPLDATATKTEDLHLASLRNLAHGFASIPTTNEILK